MPADPARSNPDHYKVVFENHRVRVLEYQDAPGDRTVPHGHPDSLMYTVSSFDRRLGQDGQTTDVHLDAGLARWVGAQEHWGENIGSPHTHCVFVELKEPDVGPPASGSP